MEGNGSPGTGRILGLSNVKRLNWIKQFGNNIQEFLELWLWVAIDRLDQQVITYTLAVAVRKPGTDCLANSMSTALFKWRPMDLRSRNKLSRQNRLRGQKQTTQIESLNANVSRYLARFRRRTGCYSKYPIMVVDLSWALLFIQKHYLYG